ncbi:MAG TPA: class D beta-lactamase [Ignavibacteria bacterium]|nr:class D beta-lactamase [Ignavibacteria bacterium]HMQ98329.1 class D beta-lactamase [Ignavibacteria bacterium]
MKTILLLLLFVTISAQAQDVKKYFDEYDVKGSFVMYDLNNDKYFYYDSARCNTGFSPASTSKIINALIGLETGVITDENFIIPWDGIKRWVDAWNKDLDLKEAMRVSGVPYFQELARRVGYEKLRDMYTKLEYGNMDIDGGVDQFWLSGALRITQMQQIDFLKRLYKEELPVSKRSMDIVKSIIVLADTGGYVMRGKTGWAQSDTENIGWLVGWVEKGGNVYFYAANVEGALDNKKFAESRRAITEKILGDLGIISK